MPDVVTNPSDKASILPPSDRKEIVVEYSVQSGPLTGTIRQILPRNLVDALANATVPGSVPTEREGTTAAVRARRPFSPNRRRSSLSWPALKPIRPISS